MIYALKGTGLRTEIELKGRMTFVDYGTFREITQIIQDNDSQYCLFDLSGLDFIDSAGLGMLLIARDKVQSRNGQVILRGAQGQVEKMLTLGKLENLFVIE